MCEGHPQLGVCLHLGPTLPPPPELERWIGEPVRAVVVSNDAFTSNKRGFPVLPKRHQEFVTNMLRRNVQVVIRASGGDGDLVLNPKGDLGDDTAVHEPTPAEAAAAEDDTADPPRRRWEYLVYLFR